MTDHKKNGFTLLELLFVVAIMGIVATIAVPRFGNKTISSKKVETTAKALMADLRLIRQMAISKNTNHYLVVDNTSKHYAIYETSIITTNQIGANYPFDSQVIYSGDTSFGFEPNGNVELGMGNSAVLSDGTNEWTLTIISSTGRVKREKTGG